MSDRIDEARALADAAEVRIRELSWREADARDCRDRESVRQPRGRSDKVRRLARPFQAEVGALRWGSSTYSGMQGRALCLAGRYEEAEPHAARPRA